MLEKSFYVVSFEDSAHFTSAKRNIFSSVQYISFPESYQILFPIWFDSRTDEAAEYFFGQLDKYSVCYKLDIVSMSLPSFL